MADDTSTQDGTGNVATQPNETTTAPPQQQPAQHADRGPGPGQQLLDAINALPERLVHAIQESAPKQTRQTAPSTTDTGKQDVKTGDTSTKDTPKQDAQKVPGKKTFAQWWFGS